MQSERSKIALDAGPVAARVISRTLRRLAPPPRLSLSQWADRFRYLSPETSAEPGRWNTARAEYLRGIMDAISDQRAERVVIMASARVGKTEVINNLCGYHIGQDPCPILVVYPTETAAEEWSRDKLSPMLRDSPTLRDKIPPARSRDSQNTTLHKVFPGGRLYIVGANAPTGLAAKNIRVVCFDEVDRYGANAGGEGSPVAQGIKRTQNFWNRKIILASSPKLAGSSKIEAEYEASDQRRYYVPCPHCRHPQVLRWANVRWPEAGTNEQRADAAAYHCEECGAAWSDAERHMAIATAAQNGGGWRAAFPERRVVGFHISVLYSPWRSIGETVAEWLAAKTPEERQVFVNTALGETWREKGDAPEWERLLDRAGPAPMGEAPEGVLAITIGADLQGDRIEAAAWGWGRGNTSWLIDAAVFPGRPSDPEAWDALDRWATKEWPRAGGGVLRALRCAVDTGGQDTAAAYGHIRRLGQPAFYMAIKGQDRWATSTPVEGPTAVDALLNGRKLRGGMKLYTVAVSTFKAEFYRYLWLERQEDGATPPGWVHLPAGLTAEQAKQLVAEELRSVKDRKGYAKQEWHPLRLRNEQLDCRVYARAALWVAGADRRGARFWDEQAQALERADMPQAPRPVVAAPPPVPMPSAPAVAAAARPVFRPRWSGGSSW
jgi:phage terminase large subunit GpA-like protein